MRFSIELQALIDLDFEVTLTGFSLAEIDLTLDQAKTASTEPDSAAEVIPEPLAEAVTRSGEMWILGDRRLLCGDARSGADVETLMGGEQADLIFTDPPYNVPIDGRVGGLGTVKHREFAFASGDMNSEQFTAFHTETLPMPRPQPRTVPSLSSGRQRHCYDRRPIVHNHGVLLRGLS